jgi:hypothetical protein
MTGPMQSPQSTVSKPRTPLSGHWASWEHRCVGGCVLCRQGTQEMQEFGSASLFTDPSTDTAGGLLTGAASQDADTERAMGATESDSQALAPMPETTSGGLTSLTVSFVANMREVYHPRIIWAKLRPVVWMRGVKLAALVVNQFTGKYLLGWSGQENRFYDAVGHRCVLLYQELYGERISVHGVRAFLIRRFQFAAFICCVSLIQIAAAYLKYPLVVMALAFLCTPITLLDRQWCALVTKMVPRYENDCARVICRHVTASLEGVAPELKSFNFRKRVWKSPLSVRAFLVATEMGFGFVQLITGTFLMGLSVMAVRNPQIYSIPWLVWVQLFARIFKDISNLVAAMLLWYLAPHYYNSASSQIHDFLSALHQAVPSPEVLPSLSVGEEPPPLLKQARLSARETAFLDGQFARSSHLQQVWEASV